MGEFLTFKKFIAPVVIQVVFWLGVVGCIGYGIYVIVQLGRYGGQFVLTGILTILLGPIVVRLYCEILVVFFRIYETLLAIRANTQPNNMPSNNQRWS